jgi:hypothetical protein
VLCIAINKSEALFSPSTRDLALGPSLFHWESQSHTRAASTGQRTIHHASLGSRVSDRDLLRIDGRSAAATRIIRVEHPASRPKTPAVMPQRGDRAAPQSRHTNRIAQGIAPRTGIRADRWQQT